MSINEQTNYNALKIKFYQLVKNTTQELDSTACDNTSISFNLPITLPVARGQRILQSINKILILNLNDELLYYQKMIKMGIDIYNPQNPVFSSRCYSFIDPDKGGDTSINYRRTTYFKNRVIVCTEGCVYKGIDSNNYIVCTCQGSNNNVAAKFIPGSLSLVSNLNLDIFKCAQNSFSKVNYIFI
jgi:hypothetical protein